MLRRSGLGLISALALAGAARAEPQLTQMSRQTLTSPLAWFGGLSGLEMADDGLSLVAVTDDGRIMHAEVTRARGRITGIKPLLMATLRNEEGIETTGMAGDSEGLAIAADGRAWISFEHDHRVAQVDLETGQTVRLAAHPDFVGFSENSGLEALATSPDGTLYALPERSGDITRPFSIYRYQSGVWGIAAHLPRNPPFLPVGADMDGECLLYLLERGITALGFRSRIQRLDLCAEQTRAVPFWQSWPGQYDNLEALSLWRDPLGQLRVVLISDDNFLRVQRTEIVEFILNE